MIASLSRPILLLVLVLSCAACALDKKIARATEAHAAAARDTGRSCEGPGTCAIDSPFTALVAQMRAATGDGQPHHVVGLLERGEDSLALRVHLIRAARRSIDVQTFIFSEDNAGYLILDELLAAARRGVRVRVLTDQLFSLDNTRLLARLAKAHVNFELRVYNPTFHKARTRPLEFAAGIVCCFARFNQRMHNKILLVDGEIGVTGGRNIDDRYFDWSDEFNYRDRDAWVVGPATVGMQASFDAYWGHPTAAPLSSLRDVAPRISADEQFPIPSAPAEATRADRVEVVKREAGDLAWIEATFIRDAFRVGRVAFFSDLPNKPFERQQRLERDITDEIRALIGTAKQSLVMQTPYLVFSRNARKQLKRQHETNPGLRMIVSTNSLAATDAFYVYAISHKYKRRYLKQLRFEIHEYKPFPSGVTPRVAATVPLAAATVSGSGSGSGKHKRSKRRDPAPLTRPGVRRGLHAKSIVVDGRVAMIGSHNFDPRSDKYNTEAGLIIWDEALAAALTREIAIDISPENAWVIAPREGIPLVSDVSGVVETVSEQLPLFDLWPFRYSTSFELKPDCAPMSPFDPDFHRCHRPVGDFPEVNLSLKDIYTRIITAFGVGLTPIL